MTTIVDVARAAGVSTATVSRVLNNQPQVDPRLAATVLQAVKALGYRPNRVARSLRTRRNRVWALILSGVRTGPFFADVVRGVEEVAYGAGYLLFLCNADEDPAKEASYIDLAIAENVGGVILMPSRPGTALTPLLSSGIPLVLIDRVLPGQEVDAVIADNLLGAYEAVKHLLARGYERVACVTGPLTITTGSQRYAGYRKALEEAGVLIDNSLVRESDFSEEGGRLAMRELLEQSERPDAVLLGNLLMTLGGLQAIGQAELAIPADIAVVGYDDMSWASLLRTPLSTVAQPTYDMGMESARLLLSRLEGYSGAPRVVTLSPSLRIRASSAPKFAVAT
ncbi:MAG TPA: LacI family DNA-binding transcriptional regulator [Acidimicrobiales bacterium]|nr:LacI family DNA-binding transcriptional regulator [Acidimicrobiales bacterium]